MYEAFYGLYSRPFQLNPDPAFYFASKQHRKAKAYLEYGVSLGQGFVVITGEIGAGKTTMLRGLLNTLDHGRVNVGEVVTTQLDADDTLRMVAAAFGVDATGRSKSQTLMALEAYLMTQATRGRRCLLVVDEAQNLTPRAVEELRMLSNFQLGTQSLLQTFLIGQPEFRHTLQRPEMEQLRQRIVATSHIGAMDFDDTQQYVTHRLHCAGAGDKPSFSAPALASIHAATHGVPRRINALCDRLLLHGFLGDKTAFDANDVDEVARELADEVGARGVAPGLSVLGASQPFAPELSVLSHEHFIRLEHSLLRLERTSLESLATLKALLGRTQNAESERL